MSCIYQIINKISKESYIGKTKHSAEFRFSKHKRQRNCQTSSSKLSESFKKYGLENFEVKTLKEGNFNKYWLARYERIFIDRLKPELNRQRG